VKSRAVLEHFGLLGPQGAVTFTLEKSDGTPFSQNIAIARPIVSQSQVTLNGAKAIPPPISAPKAGQDYWYSSVATAGTVYVQCNAWRNDPKLPFGAFAREVLSQIDSQKAQRVVIDLRNNSGGDSRVIMPLTDGLSDRLKSIAQVYLLTGPNTFSSAVTN